MSKTDILMPVYAASDLTYCMFRLCVESILQRVPRAYYGTFIIIDDHSPNPLFIQYTDYLTTTGKAKVVRNGEPRPSYYAPHTQRPTSKGHGQTLNVGLTSVKSDFVLILDPDSLVLRGNLIEESLKAFDLDPQIMAVGQLTGGFSGLKIVDRSVKKSLDISHKMSYRGVINACLVLVKMEAWTKHHLKTFENGGWAHGPFAFDIYDKGFKCCNFDYYRENYVIHFGGGMLKPIRYRENEVQFRLGTDSQANDYERKKSRDEYYAGNPRVYVDTFEFQRNLVRGYLDREFDNYRALPVLAERSDHSTLAYI